MKKQFSMPKILLLILFILVSTFTKLNAQIIVDDVTAIITYPPPIIHTLNSKEINFTSNGRYPKSKKVKISIFKISNNNEVLVEEFVFDGTDGKFNGIIDANKWTSTAGSFIMKSEFFSVDSNNNETSLGFGKTTFKFKTSLQYSKKSKEIKPNNKKTKTVKEKH